MTKKPNQFEDRPLLVTNGNGNYKVCNPSKPAYRRTWTKHCPKCGRYLTFHDTMHLGIVQRTARCSCGYSRTKRKNRA